MFKIHKRLLLLLLLLLLLFFFFFFFFYFSSSPPPSPSSSSSSSSSSGATTSIFECFGLLSIWFPLITILDAVNPILYFQFLHVIYYVIFPSVVWSPLLYWHRLPRIYFFFTILSSGIRCKSPNQLNRCAFMWFIIFLCLINSSNSSFVLILHVPCLSFVGSFLTLSFQIPLPYFFMVSFKTHTSQSYVTVGHIIL